jgi:1-acyl-sn-glycerol-3-phosphate acyltransferase
LADFLQVWATLTTIFFYKTKIVGWENLPGPDEGAVYVANHQSFLDIYTLFQLGRPFKFISKTSNFLIPIIGWSMYLTGHVPLKRMDKRSQMECLKTCLELVKQGVSVLFFPEGTRSVDGKMAAFKVTNSVSTHSLFSHTDH